METIIASPVICCHCGEVCPTDRIRIEDKRFCCEGCRTVYQLLDANGLCSYYRLNDHPGVSRRESVREDKFAFLEDTKMAGSLISFSNNEETHVRLYLPQIHCSSCLYLLENLHRLEEGVISSRLDFAAREITVVYDHRLLSLRGVAELLTSLGYEPHISLRELGATKPVAKRTLVYQLGVAGFCFANIMLLSFPEYLGLDASDGGLRLVFRWLSCSLSLPVVLYSARPFYESAWKSLRRRFLNIDAPIVLAILVTFGRSVWELVSGTGSGYFDSLSGIVFFMLAGRVLQDRTYRRLSFDRDYTAYFPMAVTVVGPSAAVKPLPEVRAGDTLLIHSGELIPADGILTRGLGLIDYSFVTGESEAVAKNIGELVYAGGRQTGGSVEVLVVKEVVQSYLTQLWNRGDKRGEIGSETSFVHRLSRYFSYVVFAVAIAAAVYWGVHDPGRSWNAVTAVLIVACPCALLLSTTFTNGNLLRILAGRRLYLRSATTIERMAGVSHIVFDKTGTLTDVSDKEIGYQGRELSEPDRRAIVTLAGQSMHPLSRALVKWLGGTCGSITDFQETPGKGIEGVVGGRKVAIDSQGVTIDGRFMGRFIYSNRYREGLSGLVAQLPWNITVSVVSGDTARERARLEKIFGPGVEFLFGQSPEGKVRCIRRLQDEGKKVMMIGDGLNDAGALAQADIGVAVSADCNSFTPASDAILQADQLGLLPAFIRLCRAGRKIIVASFCLSIVYNIIGLFFAVRGVLSPLVAAVLMPASSLSILLVTYGSSNWVAGWLLGWKTEKDQADR